MTLAEKKHRCRCTIDTLKILDTVCSLLCFSPTKIAKAKHVQLFAGILICSLQVTGIVFAYQFTVSKADFQSQTILNLLDFLTVTLSTSANIVSVVQALIVKRKHLYKLKQEIVYLQKCYMYKNSNVKSTLLPVALFISILIFDALAIAVPIDIWRHWMFWYLNSFMSTINILQSISYIEALHYAFKKFNGDIWKSWMSCHLYQRSISRKDFKYFKRHHERICDTVKLVNSCFGVQIFCFIMLVECALIRVAYLPLKLYLQALHGSALIKITLAAVGYSLSFLVFAWQLARYSIRTTAEARKLSQISHNIHMRLPSRPQSHQEKAMKEQIMLLAERTNEKSVCFSTIMFTIDNSMLLMIFNSVTTYLIILLQY
ncbi:unnamed protein product [Acanthoscelides obtectus]|uniref:Gustatory receptor n=1 Tax=Acanthoscelides obtectus TaxID=200917 RepID=A0A9P0MDH8_ACAOB|nr:unnamed protein product [Acanthoscelides obtectus]CAK1645804.1 hypothetical protein AOBTE_LOCUS14286 [Acanthoscelides obtectus]